ncbi:hypothetical protein, partial [Aliivibrio fischeri]|uniref:hypothetical protein n=1 Tax=Aliivibrio fischeri TaxID=668 RepID=UPI0035A22AE1
RIVERHQALDSKPDEHIDGELKQKAKLDECAKKLKHSWLHRKKNWVQESNPLKVILRTMTVQK